MPKEIPILFSTLMVEAILEGRKTMTRRIVKYSKKIENPEVGFTAFTQPGEFSVRGIYENGQFGESLFKMKWQKGDVLWVRETFSKGYEGVLDDPEEKYVTFKNGDQMFLKSGYVKTKSTPTVKSFAHTKWKPSIHMPKWACRIYLEITGIRAERLQDISEQDSLREGVMLAHPVPGDNHPVYVNYMHEGAIYGAPSNSFSSLWRKINGVESWADNPFVWVISFKVLSTAGMNEDIEFALYSHDITETYKYISKLNSNPPPNGAIATETK